MIDRRTMIVGASVSFALSPCVAAAAGPGSPSPFAGTPLATNRIAQLFTGVDLPLPAIKLVSADGVIDLTALQGKTRVVALWAEWCVPCLIEARDFASLQRTYAGPDFEFMSVLTSSAAKLDFPAAHARLQKAGAGGLPLLVEPNGGAQVAKAFSPTPGGVAMPCTLLVDAKGRVRGRALGMPLVDGPESRAVRRGPDGKPLPFVLSEADKRALLVGNVRSVWSTPSGGSFITALRSGALR